MAERLNGYRILILKIPRRGGGFPPARPSKAPMCCNARCSPSTMYLIRRVEAWIVRAIEKPLDDMVLLTGEGLRRLMKVVRLISVEEAFVAALGKARKFARGPKPGRALREIGLEPQITTEKPTSEGVAEILSRVDINRHRLGLQLYPDKDHGTLIGAIKAQGAEVDTVLPYAYDAQAADANIITAIESRSKPRRRDRADQSRSSPPPDRGRTRTRLRGHFTQGVRADADRLRRTGRIR